MKTTRRGFIKAAAVGAGALALNPAIAGAAESPSFGPDEVGMLYDSTLCVGCKACVYACRKANYDVDPSSKTAPKDLEDTRWFDPDVLDYRTRNIIKMYSNPEDSKDFAFVKRQCMHCNHPGCVSACPVSALTKDPVTGIVKYDKHRCIGCRYCQIACPFGVPSFEWHRAIPKITKCEMCRDTYLKDESKQQPACTYVCPTKAVIYGKRSDLMEEAKRRIAGKPDLYIQKVYGERDYGGTNVIYVSRVDFELLGLPKLPEESYAVRSEAYQLTTYKKFIAPVVLFALMGARAYQVSKKHKNDEGGSHE